MGRRSGSENRRLEVAVTTRLDRHRHATLEAFAARRSLTAPAALRALVDTLDGEPLPPPAASPRPRKPRAPKIVDGDAVLLVGLSRLLARHTGATVQLSKTLRENGDTDLHRDTERALQGMWATIRRIDALVESLKQP